MLFKNTNAQPDDNQACRVGFSTEQKALRTKKTKKTQSAAPNEPKISLCAYLQNEY